MGKVRAYSCSLWATLYWHTCFFGKWFCSQRLGLRKAAAAGPDDMFIQNPPASQKDPEVIYKQFRSAHCTTSEQAPLLNKLQVKKPLTRFQLHQEHKLNWLRWEPSALLTPHTAREHYPYGCKLSKLLQFPPSTQQEACTGIMKNPYAEFSVACIFWATSGLRHRHPTHSHCASWHHENMVWINMVHAVDVTGWCPRNKLLTTQTAAISLVSCLLICFYCDQC